MTQAELDTQDGVCISRMIPLHHLFEAAHAADPEVPRLVPIATRSLFSHARHVQPPPQASPPVVQPPAGG